MIKLKQNLEKTLRYRPILTTGDNPNRNSNETEHQVLEKEIAHGEYEDDNFIVIDEWYPENDDTEVKSKKENPQTVATFMKMWLQLLKPKVKHFENIER